MAKRTRRGLTLRRAPKSSGVSAGLKSASRAGGDFIKNLEKEFRKEGSRIKAIAKRISRPTTRARIKTGIRDLPLSVRETGRQFPGAAKFVGRRLWQTPTPRLLTRVYRPSEFTTLSGELRKGREPLLREYVSGAASEALLGTLPTGGGGLPIKRGIPLSQRIKTGVGVGSLLAGLTALEQKNPTSSRSIRKIATSGAFGLLLGAASAQPKPRTGASTTELAASRRRLAKYGFKLSDYGEPKLLKRRYYNAAKNIHPNSPQIIAGGPESVARANREWAKFAKDFDLVSSSGIPPAEWKLPDLSKWVRNLWKRGPKVKKKVLKLPQPFTEKTQSAVVKYITKTPSATFEQIVKNTPLRFNTAKKALDSLVERGVLEKSSKTEVKTKMYRGKEGKIEIKEPVYKVVSESEKVPVTGDATGFQKGLESLAQKAKAKGLSAEEFVKEYKGGAILKSDSFKLSRLEDVLTPEAKEYLLKNKILNEVQLHEIPIQRNLSLDSYGKLTNYGTVGNTRIVSIEINPYIKGRTLADTEKTLLEEITHWAQMEKGRIKKGSFNLPYNKQPHELTAKASREFHFNKFLTDFYNQATKATPNIKIKPQKFTPELEPLNISDINKFAKPQTDEQTLAAIDEVIFRYLKRPSNKNKYGTVGTIDENIEKKIGISTKLLDDIADFYELTLHHPSHPLLEDEYPDAVNEGLDLIKRIINETKEPGTKSQLTDFLEKVIKEETVPQLTQIEKNFEAHGQYQRNKDEVLRLQAYSEALWKAVTDKVDPLELLKKNPSLGRKDLLLSEKIKILKGELEKIPGIRRTKLGRELLNTDLSGISKFILENATQQDNLTNEQIMTHGIGKIQEEPKAPVKPEQIDLTDIIGKGKLSKAEQERLFDKLRRKGVKLDGKPLKGTPIGKAVEKAILEEQMGEGLLGEIEKVAVPKQFRLGETIINTKDEIRKTQKEIKKLEKQPDNEARNEELSYFYDKLRVLKGEKTEVEQTNFPGVQDYIKAIKAEQPISPEQRAPIARARESVIKRLDDAARDLFIRRQGVEAYEGGEIGTTLERIEQSAEDYNDVFLREHPEIKGHSITVYHDPIAGKDLAVVDNTTNKIVEIFDKELKDFDKQQPTSPEQQALTELENNLRGAMLANAQEPVAQIEEEIAKTVAAARAKGIDIEPTPIEQIKTDVDRQIADLQTKVSDFVLVEPNKQGKYKKGFIKQLEEMIDNLATFSPGGVVSITYEEIVGPKYGVNRVKRDAVLDTVKTTARPEIADMIGALQGKLEDIREGKRVAKEPKITIKKEPEEKPKIPEPKPPLIEETVPPEPPVPAPPTEEPPREGDEVYGEINKMFDRWQERGDESVGDAMKRYWNRFREEFGKHGRMTSLWDISQMYEKETGSKLLANKHPGIQGVLSLTRIPGNQQVDLELRENLLKEVAEAGMTLRDFNIYLQSKQAIRTESNKLKQADNLAKGDSVDKREAEKILERIKDKKMTAPGIGAEEARGALDYMGQRLGVEKFGTLEKIAKRWWALTRRNLDRAFKGDPVINPEGRFISEEMYQELTSRGEDYSPQWVADYFDTLATKGLPHGNFTKQYQDYVKRLRGNEKDVLPPVESTLVQEARLISRLISNHVNKLAYQVGKQMDVVEDAPYRVFPTGKIKHKAEVDPQTLAAVKSLSGKLGVGFETKLKIGGKGRLGYYKQGETGGEIVVKFATQPLTWLHELGHAMDMKYGLKDILVGEIKEGKTGKPYRKRFKTTEKELQELADMRKVRKAYARKQEEKVAAFVSWFVTNPKETRRVAPNSYKIFQQFLKEHPEVGKDIKKIKPPTLQQKLAEEVELGFAAAPYTPPKAKPGKIALNFIEDGKPKWFYIDADLGRALEIRDMNIPFARTLGALSRPFKAGVTSLSLGFATVNFALADIPRQAIFSKHGVQNVKDVLTLPLDAIASFTQVVKGPMGSKLYEAALRGGALFGSFQRSITPEYFEAVFQKLPSKQSKLERVAILRKAAHIVSLLEDTPKIMDYKKATDMGVHPDYAAYMSAMYGGSPNFRLYGWWGKVLNLFFTFYNPAVRGFSADTAVIKKALTRKDYHKTRMKMLLFIILPTAAAWLYQRMFHPEYRSDLEEWEKDNYWSFPRGEKRFDEDAGRMRYEGFTFAKRQPLKFIANTTETFLDWMADNDPDFVKDMATNVFDFYWPFTFSEKEDVPFLLNVGRGVMASVNPVIRLFYETLPEGGYSYFKQRSLVDQFRQKLPLELQTYSSTTDIAKIVGPKIGISPIVVDYMVKNTTGEVGRDIMQLLSLPMGEPTPTRHLPVVKRYYRHLGGATERKIIEEMNKKTEELGALNRVLKRYKRAGDREKIIDMLEKYPELRTYGSLMKIVNKWRELRNISAATQQNPRLTDEQKRARAEALYKRQQGLVLRAISLINKYSIDDARRESLNIGADIAKRAAAKGEDGTEIKVGEKGSDVEDLQKMQQEIKMRPVALGRRRKKRGRKRTKIKIPKLPTVAKPKKVKISRIKAPKIKTISTKVFPIQKYKIKTNISADSAKRMNRAFKVYRPIVRFPRLSLKKI